MSEHNNKPCRRVAIIPARGGSKRIPGKNIRPFHGKPIIRWVIETAKNCGCFDTVLVSTDDQDIASVALASGAAVPFIRPSELSDDHTPTVPVIAHALQTLKKNDHFFTMACCIYPTAVFASTDALLRGLSLLEAGDCSYVMSVTPYAHPIERALRIAKNGEVTMEAPAHVDTRSQDLRAAFHDAGQFYWGNTHAWLAHEPILSGRTKAITLQNSESHDIDNEVDWQIAELLFDLRLNLTSLSKEGRQ